MRIVLGFDDSPHAAAALRWILGHEQPEGTQVTVVSVVPTPIVAYADVLAPAVTYPTELLEQLTQHHEDLCKKAEGELRKTGFKATSKVLPGDPRAALVDVAKQENADLVVLGSHGRTGLPKLVLGSVASHVVSHAPCDVLVVKRT